MDRFADIDNLPRAQAMRVLRADIEFVAIMEASGFRSEGLDLLFVAASTLLKRLRNGERRN